MSDKSAKQEAIERLLETLVQALTPFGDEAAALAALSGIPAIDALLPYADAVKPTPREIIAARWRFLDCLRDAMDEPQRDSGGRGRKAKAKAAAKHLRAAAAGLQALDNDGVAKALLELAVLTEFWAHGSVIDVERLSSNPVEGTRLPVKGTRLLATHRPLLLSADYANKRGASSHRADLIRSVCSRLQAATPPALVASLMRDVLGIKCTHADVQQARGRQAHAVHVEADPDAVMRAWRRV